jgi:hypothetical protein
MLTKTSSSAIFSPVDLWNLISDDDTEESLWLCTNDNRNAITDKLYLLKGNPNSNTSLCLFIDLYIVSPLPSSPTLIPIFSGVGIAGWRWPAFLWWRDCRGHRYTVQFLTGSWRTAFIQDRVLDCWMKILILSGLWNTEISSRGMLSSWNTAHKIAFLALRMRQDISDFLILMAIFDLRTDIQAAVTEIHLQ